MNDEELIAHFVRKALLNGISDDEAMLLARRQLSKIVQIDWKKVSNDAVVVSARIERPESNSAESNASVEALLQDFSCDVVGATSLLFDEIVAPDHQKEPPELA